MKPMHKSIIEKTLNRIFPKNLPEHAPQNDSQVQQVSETVPDGFEPVEMGSGTISGVFEQNDTTILYEITNQRLGFQRAVKLLKPNASKECLDSFTKEFSIVSQLDHPNIAVVHSIGQWNGLHFIEMEKVSGFTVAEVIEQGGAVPREVCTAAGILICKVLEYIHTRQIVLENREYRGILHLDLATTNILLSDSGKLKLIGAGLGVPVQLARSGQFTPEGRSVSTYIPEVSQRSGTPDERSDFFSLGCILYELASGLKAFSQAQQKSKNFLPLRKAVRGFSSDFLKLVESCISIDKENRPADLETVRTQLEAIHSRTTSLTPESTIALFVNQRRFNEPFSYPGPAHKSRMATASVSGAAIIICAGLLLFTAAKKSANLKAYQGQFVQLLSPAELSKKLHNWFSPVSKNSKNDDTELPNTLPGKQAYLQKNYSESGFYLSGTDAEETHLLDTLRKQWASRNFSQVLQTIKRLPAGLAQSKEVSIYKLRSLGKNNEEIGIMLSEKDFSDGELYFHKARYLFDNSNYNAALECLGKADSVPSQFINQKILTKEIQLFRARTLSAIYHITPSQQNLDSAVKAWDKLLELNRYTPESFQNREAKVEKEKIAAEALWIKNREK